ncbi:MAG TPA: hypothetical protein VFP72_23275 [Kineosporiaceae bacterium]|nr:hypothetical protein [Kineosporiaceae bacterium]
MAVGLAAFAVGLAVRWVFTRVDVLGRARPFPVISVTVCALAALGCLIPVVQHARLERRLSAAASSVVGRPVEVRCQTLGQTWLEAHGELGYVEVGADGRPNRWTVIALQACADLSAWLGSDRRHPTRDQIVAVHVITHEAMHVAGILDEARAECAALQRDARLARALGATPEQALDLARRYWRQVYPQLSDAYRSTACRPAGELDEQLPDAPWQEASAAPDPFPATAIGAAGDAVSATKREFGTQALSPIRRHPG